MPQRPKKWAPPRFGGAKENLNALGRICTVCMEDDGTVHRTIHIYEDGHIGPAYHTYLCSAIRVHIHYSYIQDRARMYRTYLLIFMYIAVNSAEAAIPTISVYELLAEDV